jgi:hypothetical protein
MELASTAMFAGSVGATAPAGGGLAAAAAMADSTTVSPGGWATSVVPASAATASSSVGTSLLKTPALSLGLTALQTGVTAHSMATSILSGQMAQASADNQARFATLDAQNYQLQAQQTALNVQRDMLIKTGAARVAFAGAGVTSESAQPIEQSLQSQANLQIGLAKTSADMQTAGRLGQASSIRSQGDAAAFAAGTKAQTQGWSNLIDIAKRG